MLNKEKYRDEIFEIACRGGGFAVKDGKPVKCSDIECYECEFFKGIRNCVKEWTAWCEREYKEQQPPVDWANVPIDTPIMVKIKEDLPWIKRYFAGVSQKEDGLAMAWDDGTTSWTANGCKGKWPIARLATEDEIKGRRDEAN